MKSQSIGKFFHRIIPVFLLTLIACGGDDAPSDNRPSPSVVYMWSSETKTNGNIGGVNGATTHCETDAPAIAEATTGLTHRAVIGADSNDPRNYFSNNPPVQRPDRTPITNTYADFFDPAVTAITSVSDLFYDALLGLDPSGNPSTNNCRNWTSASAADLGSVGGINVTNSDRIWENNGACNESYAVMCISY